MEINWQKCVNNESVWPVCCCCWRLCCWSAWVCRRRFPASSSERRCWEIQGERTFCCLKCSEHRNIINTSKIRSLFWNNNSCPCRTLLFGFQVIFLNSFCNFLASCNYIIWDLKKENQVERKMCVILLFSNHTNLTYLF